MIKRIGWIDGNRFENNFRKSQQLRGSTKKFKKRERMRMDRT